MNAGVFAIGVLIAGFGFVAPSLGIPLSSLQTAGTAGSSISVSCVSGGPCTVTATIVNTGPTDYFLAQLSASGSATNSGCAGLFYCALYNGGAAFPLLSGGSFSWTQTIPVQNGCLNGFECSSGTFWATVCNFSATTGATFCLTPSTYPGTADYAQTSFTWTSPAPTTTTSTTTNPNAPVPLLVLYNSPITVQVSPVGSNLCQNSPNCPDYVQGFQFWEADYLMGAGVQVTATFTGATVKACISYQVNCNAVSSGVPFTVAVQPVAANGVPTLVTLIPQQTPTQPVSITACVDAPNPCASSSLPGTWSPGQASLSSNGQQSATFTFTAAQGYACPTSWYLLSTGTEQQVLTGSNPCGAGVTFTWSQMQAMEAASQGTGFDLVSSGSVTQTSGLAVSWGGAVTGVVCSSTLCPTQITGPTTLTFLAFCGAYTICGTVSWTVDGQSVPGDQNGMTYSFQATGQSYTVAANGQAATTTTTTTSSSTTSGGTLSSVSIQDGVIGLGAIVAVGGAVMPGPVKKK